MKYSLTSSIKCLRCPISSGSETNLLLLAIKTLMVTHTSVPVQCWQLVPTKWVSRKGTKSEPNTQGEKLPSFSFYTQYNNKYKSYKKENRILDLSLKKTDRFEFKFVTCQTHLSALFFR